MSSRSAIANRVVFVMALVGFFTATYLTLAHLRYLSLGCSQVHGCEIVAEDPRAMGFGIPALSAIPTAAFGGAMFFAMAVACIMRIAAGEPPRAALIGRLQWLCAAVGVLVFIWLTYLEAFVIKAWCQWCILSSLATLVIFVTLCLDQLALSRGSSGHAQVAE